jgi:hypothetical protein
MKGHDDPFRTRHSVWKTEELIDETDCALRLAFPLSGMTAADHVRDFRARQDRAGFHRLKSSRWTDHPLEWAVVRLVDVGQLV